MILPKDISVVQVGKTRLKNSISGKSYLCKYSDVPKDKIGWVTDLSYLPITGDMMTLRILDRVRDIAGWWDGRKWVGLRIKPNDKVTAWKRVIYYD